LDRHATSFGGSNAELERRGLPRGELHRCVFEILTKRWGQQASAQPHHTTWMSRESALVKVFGRLPSARVDRVVMQASENLHKSW